ncbi:MAG TPA: hydrogenase maturation protease [Gemmatimonadales bacterium]|jgi:hydrogenase maturation protease|nr:hydrogenase maturation protease [Gemmatimonadales bacterium]
MSDLMPHSVPDGDAMLLVAGMAIVPGSPVQLMPRAGRDIFDLALAGRRATVESVERDLDGSLHVVVTIDDDPARDFRDLRFPCHRFFFRPDELVPLSGDATRPGAPGPRILVAGIGNIFRGDDGFGVAVVDALQGRPRRGTVDVVDYGIRGMDLAYALARYEAAILVDAAPQGAAPGTVAVLDPRDVTFPPAVDTHGMDPVKVLGLAQSMGAVPHQLYLVVCEPAHLGAEDDVVVGLSPVVQDSIMAAVDTIERLLTQLTQETTS